MATPLTSAEIDTVLATLPGWAMEDDTLVKTYRFGSFREAMGFVTRVAFEAEELNHHPELTNVYNRVRLALTTHDAGNRVTAKDVELAQRVEHISWV